MKRMLIISALSFAILTACSSKLEKGIHTHKMAANMLTTQIPRRQHLWIRAALTTATIQPLMDIATTGHNRI